MRYTWFKKCIDYTMILFLVLGLWLLATGSAFLFGSFEAAQLALIGCVLLTALSVIFGDKAFLSLVKARKYFYNREVRDLVNNYSCRLGMPRVSIYKGRTLGPNIYYFDSFVGQPTLLFTGNIENLLSPSELQVVLYSALLKIKSGEAKMATLASLVLGLYYLPVGILRNVKERCHALFTASLFQYPLKGLDAALACFEYFYYPLEMIKVMLFKRRKNVLKFDRQVCQELANKKDLASALFKLNEIGRPKGQPDGDILSELFENFSVAQNKKSGVLIQILDLGISPRERYLALN